MAKANMTLHVDANCTTFADLCNLPDPDPRGNRHVPVRHEKVILDARKAFDAVGLCVAQERIALTKDTHRMFATFDLAPQCVDVELARDGFATVSVGVRNSHDMRFALGAVGGSRVFVCDNLAFSGGIVASRKHEAGIDPLDLYAEVLQECMTRGATHLAALGNTARVPIGDKDAFQFFGLALLAGAMNQAQHQKAAELWFKARDDKDDKYHARTLWSAYNCVTDAYHSHATPEQTVERCQVLNALTARQFNIPQLALAG